jgi:ABC-2 type transport system permease protein
MSLPITVFRFEWYSLLRNRMLLCSLAVFTLISLLAIHTGRQNMQDRLVQIDSIQTVYQHDFEEQCQLLKDTSAAGKNTGMAAVVNFRLPQNAIWTPQPLQTLSIGITDIQPFYHQVQTTINYQEPANIPVSNPVRLFAGNFDLSFVWIYVLPLLVIAFCYPLYAGEKETGTAALLMIQSISIRSVIAYKLLFRMMIISSLVLLLNLTGFLFMSGSQGNFAVNTWWCIITQLYILVWCAIAWAVVCCRLSSTLTALLLTGCWLLTVMIGPALVNIYVLAHRPVPLHTELASLHRQESEEIWAMPPYTLVDSFNAAHPQYAGSMNYSKDTVHGSNRFFAGYYYLLEKRMDRAAALLDSQVAARNRYFEKLAAFDPVLRTQHLFNELAGTSLADYVYYREQVTAFRQQWKAFLYPWQLSNTLLGPQQFRQFPVFHLQRRPVPVNHLAAICLQQIGLILFLSLAGVFMFNRNKQ